MQRSVGDQQEILSVHGVHYHTFCLRAVHSHTTDAALAVSIVHLREEVNEYIKKCLSKEIKVSKNICSSNLILAV